MKVDQAKAAILAQSGERVAALFDAFSIAIVSAADPGTVVVAELEKFRWGVGTVMSICAMAIEAVDGLEPTPIAPAESDGAFRVRILNAGARGSVNEARVLVAADAALDEAGGWYGLERKGKVK